jgi:arginase
LVLEARVRAHPDLQLVWIDAHADLNTPETSPSGHVHGMALRLALGEGDPDLVSRAPLDPASVTLVGTRVFDPGERACVDDRGLPVVPPGPAERLAAAVTDRLAPDRPVHLHIDLDSLDPAAFPHVNYPAPGGLTPDALLAVIAAAGARSRLVGVTLTEYAPREPGGGMAVIRRVLGEGFGVPLRPA